MSGKQVAQGKKTIATSCLVPFFLESLHRAVDDFQSPSVVEGLFRSHALVGIQTNDPFWSDFVEREHGLDGAMLGGGSVLLVACEELLEASENKGSKTTALFLGVLDRIGFDEPNKKRCTKSSPSALDTLVAW